MIERGAGEDVTRVLLVDDDPELLKGIGMSLRHEGHEVTALSSAENIALVVTRLRPHVVVLDVMMPGIDGWEALKVIRQDSAIASTPVLMLSAKDSEEAKILGFSLGADDYLTKPFSVGELRCRVAALIRRSRQTEALDCESTKIPVMAGASGHELLSPGDVFHIVGVRNYTYVYLREGRLLSRLSLKEMEDRLSAISPKSFMRVHRSHIVNLDKVRGCRWASRSSYRLTLSDEAATEIAVSRALVFEVQRRLEVR